jgi:hypothetical protein
VHFGILSSITGDDAEGAGGDDASPQTESFSNFGAGLSLNPATDTATDFAAMLRPVEDNTSTTNSVATLGPVQDRNSTTDAVPTMGPTEDRNSGIDPAPTLGPVEDKSSAGNEHLVGTSGGGGLPASLGPRTLHGEVPSRGPGDVSPQSSDSSPHAAPFGVGDVGGLISGAGIVDPFGPGGVFGAGSVLVGAGRDGGGNGLASTGADGFFGAMTGSFSPPAGQGPELGAGSLNLDSQLSQLVQAMATYSADSPGFASSLLTQVSNDSSLLGAIAPAGHL